MGIRLENRHCSKVDGGATELNKLRDKFGQTAWVRIERNRSGKVLKGQNAMFSRLD